MKHVLWRSKARHQIVELRRTDVAASPTLQPSHRLCTGSGTMAQTDDPMTARREEATQVSSDESRRSGDKHSGHRSGRRAKNE
jgi:hypothetical protein